MTPPTLPCHCLRHCFHLIPFVPVFPLGGIDPAAGSFPPLMLPSNINNGLPADSNHGGGGHNSLWTTIVAVVLIAYVVVLIAYAVRLFLGFCRRSGNSGSGGGMPEMLEMAVD